MNQGDLCEADGPLPDGNNNYDIDNCPGKYDIFKCVKGKSVYYYYKQFEKFINF